MSDKVKEAKEFLAELATREGFGAIRAKAIYDKFKENSDLDEGLTEIACEFEKKKEHFIEKIEVKPDVFILLYERKEQTGMLDTNKGAATKSVYTTYYYYRVVDRNKLERFKSDFISQDKQSTLLYAALYLITGKEDHQFLGAIEMFIAGFKKIDKE